MGARRGQITVYIIIGLIALVGVSVFLYMRTVKVEAPITYTPTLDTIPVEAEPLREFVTSCLRQVAENGLRRIGDYGGYIDFEHMDASYNPYMPTESEAVNFAPGSDQLIPYWWYMKSPNNCARGTCYFSSKKPNLYKAQGEPSIEGQLDEYVNENMGECLMNFEDFAGYGFVVSEAGAIDTKTVVTQESVAFHLKYPLVAEKAGVTHHVNDYFVDIVLNLKEIYELAERLYELEAEQAFLEYYIRNVISVFSRIDENALPPITDVGTDSAGGVRWTKSGVKGMLSQILTAYYPYMRVIGTKNYRYVDIPEGTEHREAKLRLRNQLNAIALDPNLEETHPGLDVYFSYMDWGEFQRMYFDLSPCTGEMCMPEGIGQIGSQFPAIFLQFYNFAYDVSLPVLVSIVNSDALNERGYSFKFFMEANQRNNEAVAKNITLPEVPSFAPVGGTMVCDQGKRTSPEAIIDVVNGMTGIPVPDAFVKYKCGDESCTIGQTDSDGQIRAQYPVCVGGSLEVTKEGYLGASVLFSTVHNQPIHESVIIAPYIYKDIKVMKFEVNKQCLPVTTPGGHNITQCNWVVGTTPKKLDDYEEATIMMKKHPGEAGKAFTAMADYTGDDDAEDHSESMQLLSGIYDIDVTLIDRMPFTIPSKDECYYSGIWPFGSDECFTIDAMEFGNDKPLFAGGVELYDVPITASSLGQNDIIVLYAFSIELADVPAGDREPEDMSESGNIDIYSANYRSMVLPTYRVKDDDVDGVRGGTFQI